MSDYRTPYSAENQEFTDAAHKYAAEYVYARFFAKQTIKGIQRASARGDYQHGTDYVVTVRNEKLSRGDIIFTFQERFRTMGYWTKYRELTITEFNPKSGLGSEMYKLHATHFMCGGFDGKAIVECAVIPSAQLVKAILDGMIPWTKGAPNERTGQDYVCVKLDDLGMSMDMSKVGGKRGWPWGSMFWTPKATWFVDLHGWGPGENRA